MPYSTTLTDGGKSLLQSVLVNQETIIFTDLKIGNGTPPLDASEQTALVNFVVSAGITSIERGEGFFARIIATLHNNEVQTMFNVTELGLYACSSEDATPVLYAYVGITEGDGGSIPPGSNILMERDYAINVYVGDAEAAATVTSGEAVTFEDLENHNRSDTAHENRFQNKQDKTNLLTASSNLADADYVPFYDTSAKVHRKFTLANLYNYVKNKIALTMNDISGILSVNKGGTGKTSLTNNGTLIGQGTGAISAVASTKGAYHVTVNGNTPQFGTLPVSVGGTGLGSVTSNATVIGNGTGVLKTVSSKLGAYYATEDNGTPRFGTLPVNAGGSGRSALTSHAVMVGNGTGQVTMIPAAAGAFYSSSNTENPRYGILPKAYGGTGNSTGYVRAGLESGTTPGNYSTAEGIHSSSEGSASHAEGQYAVAYGNYSHAEGLQTIANARSQHVFGEYNIAEAQNQGDKGSYVEIVGNGTSSARKNARTLDWSGNEALAGNLTPMVDNSKDLGSASFRWKNVFASLLNGTLAKKVTFNNGGEGAASGAEFNSSANVIVSYNTVGAAAASHTHTPANITTNGAFGAYVQQKASAALGTAYVRNIYAGTQDMTAGTSALPYGTIYLVYE